MKKFAFLLFVLIFGFKISAQDKEYSTIKKIPHTAIKNQHYSGTCWCFATISFIESELIRKGTGVFDLSEMYVVYKIYKEKAITHIRYQGYNYFTPGGQASDVMFVLKKYGILPEFSYSGLISGTQYHDHLALDSAMKRAVDSALSTKLKGITTAKIAEIDSLLDTSLGKPPAFFHYESQEYSPKTFFTDILNIDPKDYIDLTSFLHQPYYQSFCLRDKYNWASHEYLNLPLEELYETVTYAILQGYSFVWNGDVSEWGFDFNNGTAKTYINSENATAQIRQELYNTQETTVDHLMHIIGIVKDKQGDYFFLVKNSWGMENRYDGYMLMSEDYFKLKTVSVMLHKDAIPFGVRKKISE